MDGEPAVGSVGEGARVGCLDRSRRAGHAWVTRMDLAAVLATVDALCKARDGEGFVLLAADVVEGMQRVFAADEISMTDHHLAAGRHSTLALWPAQADGDPQWSLAVTCADCTGPDGPGHALAVSLPGPHGAARMLVFSRRRPFGEEDRSAAVLLQPHVAEALRCHGRRAAARLLTSRQRELLRLVAAGHDNTAIARQLGLSPCTVRKHLENAFARLEVSTRAAAVAKVCPDVTW